MQQFVQAHFFIAQLHRDKRKASDVLFALHERSVDVWCRRESTTELISFLHCCVCVCASIQKKILLAVMGKSRGKFRQVEKFSDLLNAITLDDFIHDSATACDPTKNYRKTFHKSIEMELLQFVR